MVLGLILVLSGFLIAPPPPQLATPLDALLDRAAENARRYTDAMRNLTADERRETELFDRMGRVRKRRQTRASLVVHQAGTSTLAEFRRVFEVDGKAVKTSQDSLESLLQNLSTSQSIDRELELIQRESSKYDLEEMQMRGMSLNQAWPLEDPDFRKTTLFRREGSTKLVGRDTVIVRYENFVHVPDSWRVKNIEESFKPTRVFVRGRIWVDAETAEIWRYETETMVEEGTLKQAEVWDRMEFYYAPSSFGIPTPQKIVWTSNTGVSRNRGKLELHRTGMVTAEFGPFRRFGVEAKITPVTP
jgi:hypothetical protein